MKKIAFVGATGKVGRSLCPSLAELDGYSLILQLSSKSDIGQELMANKPDILIDFTTPGAIKKNIPIYLSLEVPFIIGTTGLFEEDIATLDRVCRAKKIGGILACNFSVSAVIMQHVAKIAHPFFSHCHIIEAHNPSKKDCPSGTSINTKKQLELLKKDSTIPISSIRMPGYVASQKIIFSNDAERLSIKSECNNREVFFQGLKLALEHVCTLHTLVHGLDKLLFSNSIQSNMTTNELVNI